MLPEPVKKFVELFAKLPGIGPRQATRIAFHISNQGKSTVGELSKAVAGLVGLKNCSRCFVTTPNKDVCDICSNSRRRQDLIAVVEKETDLLSLEKTGKYEGIYLVLGEIKKDGALNEMQKLRLKTIKNVEEVILAINPTAYGDLNASLVTEEIKKSVKKITRLGRGIPTGGEIEFADEETLSSSIKNRS